MLGSLTLPLSALELREAVRDARRYDAARLDRVLRVDESHGRAEVQASTSWAALAERAGLAGDFAPAWRCAGSTVGAAVGSNGAGPDGRPVVAHVESLALVTAEGELRQVSRTSHPELFRLVVGGQGIFGTPYSITLNMKSLSRTLAERQPFADLELPATQRGGRPLHLLVPPPQVEAFVADCRAVCDEWRMPLGGVSVRRVLAENETALCWATREYAEVQLLLPQPGTIGGAVRATQVRRALIDAALARSGSFPIAATPEATAAHVQACYPRIRDIFAEKRRLDPAEKIRNAWYRHHKSLLWPEACEVRWSS